MGRRSPWAYRAAWIVLLLLAAALRFPHADWDAGLAVHPDERFLLQVAERMAPADNPCRVEADFPYGHLPLYAAAMVTHWMDDPAALFTLRLLSALAGVVLVVLAGAWGAALGGRRAAYLSAALLAVAPFPLQQARFFTVDPFAALGGALALLAAARSRPTLAGVSAACAVASKATLALIIPLLLPPLARRRATLVDFAYAFALTFVFMAPWMVLTPLRCWRGPLIQAAILRGRYPVPYTVQFIGNPPYLYPLLQMALWGLGPTVVLAGLVGMGLAWGRWRFLTERARLALAWMLFYSAVTGLLLAQFPRYYLPLYPLWTAWAARSLPRRAWGVWAAALLLPTALLGAAQLGVYAQPHPYVTASTWIAAHVPQGSLIANEHWDDALPHGRLVAANRYPRVVLPVMDEDTPEKLAALEDALARAHVVTLATPRAYGVIGRHGARYPLTRAWYARLLSNPAYEVVSFGRCPRLGPLALSDDPLADAALPQPLSLAQRCGTPYALRLPRLDESFRVYDAPQTMLLVKRVPASGQQALPSEP